MSMCRIKERAVQSTFNLLVVILLGLIIITDVVIELFIRPLFQINIKKVTENVYRFLTADAGNVGSISI